MQNLLQRVLSAIVALSLVLGPIQSVVAQELTDAQKEEFQKHTESAGEKFQAKDYNGAVESFKQAYELKAVSNILYNIARIYEQTGEMENALEYYELFVKSPNVEHGPRQDALERIKALNEVLALQEKPEKEDAPIEKESAPEPEPVDHTLAYVFWGTGAVALGTSLAFALLASGEADTFDTTDDLQEARDAADTGATYSLVADGMLVTGVVLATVGTVLFLTDGPSETEDGVTIAPFFGRDHVGVGLGSSF